MDCCISLASWFSDLIPSSLVGSSHSHLYSQLMSQDQSSSMRAQWYQELFFKWRIVLGHRRSGLASQPSCFVLTLPPRPSRDCRVFSSTADILALPAGAAEWWGGREDAPLLGLMLSEATPGRRVRAEGKAREERTWMCSSQQATTWVWKRLISHKENVVFSFFNLLLLLYELMH